MAGSWDFTADSNAQRTLATKLKNQANSFDNRVDDLYKEINSMGLNKYWVGEDYEKFQSGTLLYEKALQDLSNGIRMFATHFEKIANGTDALATELIEIVMGATGSAIGSGNGNASGSKATYVDVNAKWL